MTQFVLVPGAGGSGWYWHRVVAQLNTRGHVAVAIDLPGADPASGLNEYRDEIVAAVRAVPGPVVLVAQSLGAFSAPLACAETGVEQLVLVNPMIPAPGETAGQWWDNVGWFAAAKASADHDGRPAPDVNDLETLFWHDVAPELVEVMRSSPEAANEAPAIFGQPWPLTSWPPVPTTVLIGRDDRFFPAAWQRRLARQRLGLPTRELAGGHLMALSQPGPLTEALLEAGRAAAGNEA